MAHDLSAFNSGNAALDVWLRHRARLSEGKTARTYVVCEASRVVGYYCLSTGSVDRHALPGKIKRTQGLPHHEPVVIIGRLARDISFRRYGLGGDLLRDALLRVLELSQIAGIRAVLVHSVDDPATAFWMQHGFIETPIGSQTLFLPVENIAAAL